MRISAPARCGFDPAVTSSTCRRRLGRSGGAVTTAGEDIFSRLAMSSRTRGVAVHKSFGSFVAQIADVSKGSNGLPKVHKVWCAVDCGVAGNPNVVTAQMEGGIGYGLGSEALPLPSPRACFWGGYGGSLVVNDCDARMTTAYVMNRMAAPLTGDSRGAALLLSTLGVLAAG